MFTDRFADRTQRRDVAVGPAPAIQARVSRVPVTGLIALGYVALLVAAFAPGTLTSWLPGQGAAGVAATRPGAASTAAPPAIAPRGAPLPAVPAVDQYLKGAVELDAQLMWSALSPEQVATMRARGASPETLQKELDELRQRGVRYEGAEMVAAYPLRSGEAYLFYVLSRRGVAGPDRLDRVNLVFTLDGTGKISDVSWNRPEDLRPSRYGPA
jgi:hypothetical protein